MNLMRTGRTSWLQQGIPRRPEIAPAEFASSVECELIGQIPFEAALFGTAANNGQMIAEVSANHRSNETYRLIGTHVTGRNTPDRATGKVGSMKLPSFLKRKRA